MVDGSSRKRKADGREDPVGTSSRHVDEVDAIRGWDLLSKGPDGSASHPPIFTNSGLLIHALPVSAEQPQPRIHARHLTLRKHLRSASTRHASQILPLPPHFQLLAYGPPTILSASQDPGARFLVVFYPLVAGKAVPRRQRLLNQGSLSGCLVLYVNETIYGSAKPNYQFTQYWDLQSDIVDVLWLNQPRQWTFDEKLCRTAAPAPIPGASESSFMILTAHGMVHLYVPQQINPKSSTPPSAALQCLECPIGHLSASTPLQSYACEAQVSDRTFVGKSSMARSPVDNSIYIAVEMEDYHALPSDYGAFTSWDWTADGMGAATVKQGPKVNLSKLGIDLFGSSGPVLRCTPLPPIDIDVPSDGDNLRPGETALQYLVLRHASKDENEEDDPLFASSPEDTKDKPPGSSCGLELVVALASRSDEPQSSRSAGFTSRIDVFELNKLDGGLLEGFAALMDPPKAEARPATDRMIYRRSSTVQLDQAKEVRHMQLNKSDPAKVLLLTAEINDCKSRLYLSHVEAVDSLPRGELVQQPSTISFHPDDRIDSISVSPGQQRGCGVLAISSRSSWRADLVVGQGSGSQTAQDLVRRASQAVACAVLQGTSFDDTLIAAAVSSSRLAEGHSGLAEKIVEQTWRLLAAALPSKAGAVLGLAEDMMKVQHLCFSAFGDDRGRTGLQTMKVVQANKELEAYLDGINKDTSGVATAVPDAMDVVLDLERSIVLAGGKLEWAGQMDADADQRLSMTLNVVALSALQGFAGNLVRLQQKLSAEPDIQPGTVSSLEKLLRLQSEKSLLRDRLSSSGVILENLESALTELASDPSLAPSSDSISALLITSRPMDVENALHKVITALAPSASAKLFLGMTI